jgi:hypothetical protein
MIAINAGIHGKWYGQFGYDSAQSFWSLIVHINTESMLMLIQKMESKYIWFDICFHRSQVTTPAATIPNIKCKKNKNGL